MADIEATLRQISNENTAKTFDFNSREAKKERDWSKMMSDTSHQREVEDLKRSGLNPVLSANGGASAYSASSASGTADNSAVGMLASLYETKLNNANAEKIARQNNLYNEKIAKANNKANLKQTKISAEAQKYASDNAYAAARLQYEASLFGSNKSYEASTYSTDKSKYGMIDNFISEVLGTSPNSRNPSAKQIGKNVNKSIAKSFKNIFKKGNSATYQNIKNRNAKAYKKFKANKK